MNYLIQNIYSLLMAFLENLCGFQCFAQLVAGCVLLNFVWGCWNLVYIYCLGKFPDFHKYGKWSVVTGGTDGIGLAFVNKLAALGQNVVIISRNPEKVKNVATGVAKEYNVETKQIAVDFGRSDIYQNIAKDLEGLDVGTLVNNVGTGFEPLTFLEFADQPQMVEKVIAVNAESLAKMTQIILPQMVEKRRGIVINMGSAGGIYPTPFVSMYSATKMFVDCFSKCMHSEYSDKGIISMSIMPFTVSTKMTHNPSTNLIVLTPANYVSSALKTIGRCRRSYGCLSHAIQGKVIEALPDFLVSWFVYNMFSTKRQHELKFRESASKTQ
uniref:Estradiol 17-beta-dehydrogenase 12 n=1 Tax=Phallusia mammillata TaxID=59560 RepID=A0A6F9DFE8_9ASCI|nr:estradiol 17-beta-dehydrogenase 12 [Phallusia mammillata]